MRPDLGTAVVLLTHDDKFDLPMIKGTLATDAFYIGLAGLAAEPGAAAGAPARGRRRARSSSTAISGPCGLDIGAESPAETALSMLAEILARRAGRAGGSLKASRHRIHAEPAVAPNKK